MYQLCGYPHLEKGVKRDVTKTRNGEWGMGNGEWGMGNGEWGMGNGEWGMGNGEWGLPLNRLTRRLQTIHKKSNERRTSE